MTSAMALQRDFAPFVDPATELKISQGSHGVRLQFIRNGTEHDYFINLADLTVVARHAKGKKYTTIRSLIASSDFADIRSLAATQVRMLKAFNSEALIPPEGEIRIPPGEVSWQRLTRLSLQHRISPLKYSEASGGTNIGILLIDGPAGVGKTSLIQSILVARARRQQEANSLPPILHVTSRGLRLTGLNQALAQSIDLIRAKFTFDQTPILIRNNLLQVAIDGFDELVDPEGYRDAWFALRDFFEDVGFGGPIILAGRDTFFDQQSFLKQLESSKYAFDLTHVRLSPVSPSTARQWLKQRGWADTDLADPYTNIVLREGSYALRPYFLSQLATVKSWEAIDSRDLTPRAFLVENFLKREARLLSSQLGVPVANVKQNLTNLFEEIALEMADNEADTVDLGFLQLVTEVAFGQLLEPRELAKLQHKAGSFALLETDTREGHRRFPHTEISHHFLAAALIRTIVADAHVRFLRRGALTSDLLAIFAEIFSGETVSTAQQFVTKLERTLLQEATFDRLSENAASLLITSLCHQFSTGSREYHDLLILDAVLFGVVAAASLHRVKFQRLDAREADLTQVKFIECEVITLTADSTTRFGTRRPLVHQLLLATEKGSITELFEPDEIAEWIGKHSTAIEETKANREATQLLERICRVMLRQHMIKDHPSDQSGRLLQNPYWKEVEKILMKASVVDRIENKGTSGAAASFLRMRDPFKILVHRDDDRKVKAIWDQVGAILRE